MVTRLFARPTPREASTPAQSNRPTPKNKFEIRGKRIRDFVFLHDNIHVVCGSEDGTMRKWDCDTGFTVGKPLKSKGGRMYALALSPDGKMIACGRADGSVQQLNTDGKMMLQSVWRSRKNWVRSLSWSPSGGHIASGSFDGEILIRKVESGYIEVGPIETKQVGVSALAYSPSGERIASGGYNSTICIWDTKTGQLAVGPIKNLWNSVMSVAWSSDSAKLYSASDFFARVFDSKSGALLLSLEHDHILFSVALSPQNNVFACVGSKGVAQLWDAESYQPLGQPFHDHVSLRHVTFSRDGNYLAYCGMDGGVTLWMVKDIAVELEAPTLPQQGHGQPEETFPELQQRTRAQSPSSSFLDADATGGDGIIEDVRDDPYNNFFQSSQTSLPASPPQPPNLSPRKFLAWRACSNTPLKPAATASNQPTPEGRLLAEENNKASTQDADASRVSAIGHNPLNVMDDQCPPNTGLGANKLEVDEGKQRGSLTNTQSSLAELNGNIWKWSMRARGKDPKSVSVAPRSEVVEMSTVHGFQTKSSAVTCSAPLTTAHTSGSSQPAPSSTSRTLSSQLNCRQRDFAHDSLSATKNKGKQRDDPPPDAQSPSHDRTLPAHLDSKDSRSLLERSIQAPGKNSTFASLYSSTRPTNAPQRRIPRNPWHWNSSLSPRSSRHPVDVAACRDEDRYAIAPESDTEAAAAMLRTNDDVADSSTRQGQPAVRTQVSRGRPTQTQASTSGPEEIVYEGVSCCGFFFGYRRRSNSHQS
ncbi:quinon protein alcohol dehydrogenase-like superfamily [Suillus subluteus]|nr:quinon protein alcohol dehydrogenase-like superfamily [Suillus subluteus]